MPLVNIRSKFAWHPARRTLDKHSEVTLSLGRALPQLLTDHGKELRLDEDTPPDAVQVDFEQFHTFAINAPDIWVLVRFTEVLAKQVAIRDVNGTAWDIPIRDIDAEHEVKLALQKLIDEWLDEKNPETKPKIAVDMFWGPGHGFLDFGDVKLDW